jgi:hypothetical protein
MLEARFHAVLGGSHHLDIQLDLPRDFPPGQVEIIVRPTPEDTRTDTNLDDLFATIDRMPRRRLSKTEIDAYIAEERASWD